MPEILTEPIKHVGAHAGRLNHPCSAKEKALAERWAKENNPPSFINGGHGVLDWLLHASEDQHGWIGEVTQEEARIAASVIQWLGTNCGWCFLEEALKDCGHVIHEAHYKQRDPVPAERAAFAEGAAAMRDAIVAAIKKDQAWVDIGKVCAVPVPDARGFRA